MKCTNKIISILLIASCIVSLTGCGSADYGMEFSRQLPSSAYMVTNSSFEEDTLAAFSGELCVDSRAQITMPGVKLEYSYASGLFDLNQKEILYAENIYEQLPPASLTKIMTALVALKYGNLQDEIVVTENCKITESGAQVYNFKPGDVITLDQAMNVLLIYSANDVGLIIAEHISGDVDSFCALMNEEAKALGATSTNFTNPHGLTAENHYTTVYDLYLIFNEVIQYERFREIIQLTSYTSVYKDAQGNQKTIEIRNTNQYFMGNVEAPESITVLGGKTGTTNAAGNCLILYIKDNAGNPYISVILRADKRENLYNDMNMLLEAAGK